MFQMFIIVDKTTVCLYMTKIIIINIKLGYTMEFTLPCPVSVFFTSHNIGHFTPIYLLSTNVTLYPVVCRSSVP